jgi:nucleoside-diphosphate-sugar epimerase
MNNIIGVIGHRGFVGSAICRKIRKKICINRNNYLKFKKKKFDIIINCSMPSRRFWAKQNPKLDFNETVIKTKFFLENYNYKKFIHISSISARCETKTVYGKNKKKSELLVKKQKNYLIIRLGPLYGKKLTKGVIIDMINNHTVYINKNSNYSFTSVDWASDWILKNLYIKNKTVEIGSKNFIKLKNLAKNINSKSRFIGRVDNQIIKSNRLYNSDSNRVYEYIKRVKTK